MNILMWVLAGGFAGWVGFKYIHANASRGLMTSLAIGICGGYFGGSVLAPMLSEAPSMPDALSPGALLMAISSAAVCLTIAEMIWRRFAI